MPAWHLEKHLNLLPNDSIDNINKQNLYENNTLNYFTNDIEEFKF